MMWYNNCHLSIKPFIHSSLWWGTNWGRLFWRFWGLWKVSTKERIFCSIENPESRRKKSTKDSLPSSNWLHTLLNYMLLDIMSRIILNFSLCTFSVLTCLILNLRLSLSHIHFFVFAGKQSESHAKISYHCLNAKGFYFFLPYPGKDFLLNE